MAITVPGSAAASAATLVRNDVTAADSTTLNDTNFPPADATECAGWESVTIYPVHNGGTAPTTTIQVLQRFGLSWIETATTTALADGQSVTVNVFGRSAFFRVHAITGSPTNVDVYCAGAKAMRPGATVKA